MGKNVFAFSFHLPDFINLMRVWCIWTKSTFYSPFSCCLVEQSIQLCWFAAQIISNWWKRILNFQE